MISIVREYTLEVAHRLTAGVPERHKCRRPHGHRYEVEIEIGGDLDEYGMLAEYGEIDATVKPILALVDHHDMNGLADRCSTAEARAISANPTVERLAAWLGHRLALLKSVRQEQSIRVLSISVREDPRAKAVWRPDTARPTPGETPAKGG